MIVQRSMVEEASGPRSLLAIKMNKDPASDLVHQATILISIYSQRCKTRWSPKEEFVEGLRFCHSINLKEAQRKAPIEFQFGQKSSLLGFFEYYLEKKHLLPSLESW